MPFIYRPGLKPQAINTYLERLLFISLIWYTDTTSESWFLFRQTFLSKENTTNERTSLFNKFNFAVVVAFQVVYIKGIYQTGFCSLEAYVYILCTYVQVGRPDECKTNITKYAHKYTYSQLEYLPTNVKTFQLLPSCYTSQHTQYYNMASSKCTRTSCVP